MDLLILLYIPHVSPSCWFSSSLGWRRHGFAPGRSRVQFWAHAHTNERNHSSTVSLMLISAAPPLPLSASLTGKVRKRWFRTFRFMRKRNWLDLMSGGRLKARQGGGRCCAWWAYWADFVVYADFVKSALVDLRIFHFLLSSRKVPVRCYGHLNIFNAIHKALK
jgi:hypothetical protein